MVINPILLGLLGLTTTTYALLAESASTWTVNRVLAQAVDGQASLAFTIDVGLPPKSPWPSTKSCVRDWDKFIDPGVALPTTWSPCHTDVWVAWRFLPGAEVELNFPYDFKVQVAFWDQKGENNEILMPKYTTFQVGGSDASSAVMATCNEDNARCEYEWDGVTPNPQFQVHSAGEFPPIGRIHNVTTESLHPDFPLPVGDICHLDFRLNDDPDVAHAQFAHCSVEYPCFQQLGSTADPLITKEWECDGLQVKTEIVPAYSPDRTVRQFTIYLSQHGHLSFNASSIQGHVPTEKEADVEFTLLGTEAYDTYRGAAGACVDDWCTWEVKGKDIVVDHPRFEGVWFTRP